MSNFVIKDIDTVKEKTKLLNSLKDIRVTAQLAKTVKKSDVNPLDQKY